MNYNGLIISRIIFIKFDDINMMSCACYKAILSLTLFSIYVDCYSQHFTNYNTQDGISSNEVYDAFEDSYGYMWFATSSGISVFDGSRFTSYNTSDGIPGNTIFGFYEDSKERIWFRTFNGKIGYFNLKTRNFVRLQTPQEFEDYHIVAIWESNSNIIIVYRTGNQIIISEDGQIIHDNTHYQPQSFTAIVSVSDLSKEEVYIKKEFEQCLKSIGPKIMLGTLFQYRKSNSSELLIINNTCYSRHRNQKVFRKHSWNFSNFKGISTFQGYDKPFYVIHGDSISEYNLQNDSPTFRWSVPNASQLFVDQNGGIWISSLTDGVFYCKDITILEKPDFRGSNINHITSINGNLYFSKDHSTLIKSTKDTTKFWVVPGEIQEIRSAQNESVLVTAPISYVLEKDEMKTLSNGGRYYAYAKDSYWGIISGHALLQKKNVQDNHRVYKTNLPSQLFRDLFFVDDNIWITRLLGCSVYRYDSLNDSLIYIDERLEKARVSDIDTINGLMIIATRGEGLFISNKNRTEHLTIKKGLSSNIIFDCEVSSNDLWIATPNGINKIDLTDFNNSGIRERDILLFNSENSLSTDHINDIAVQGDKLYYGAHSGLFNFPVNYVPKRVIPKLYVIDILADSVVIKKHDHLVFSHDKNAITFTVQGIHFPSGSNLRYFYRLNNENKWTESQSNSITFLNLAPGDYQLSIKCATISGMVESTTVSISFSILPPFYKTTWFLITCTVLAILGIILFLYWRRKKIQAKLSQENEIIRLKNLAARAQLNPHFVFNSLNSVQNYISKNRMEDAEKYLSQFSKLIRWVLNDQEEDLVSISTEVEFLNVYISLEQMRLRGSFKYAIEIDQNLDADIKLLPPFLVQPFVENAIWHGLPQRKNNGFLKIMFNRMPNAIIITIEDNGVGIRPQDLDKVESSLGLSISKQRLDLFKKMHHKDVDFTIENLAPSQQGTRVEIKIMDND